MARVREGRVGPRCREGGDRLGAGGGGIQGSRRDLLEGDAGGVTAEPSIDGGVVGQRGGPIDRATGPAGAADDPAARLTTTDRASPGRRMPFAEGAAMSTDGELEADGEGLGVAAEAAETGSATPATMAPAARVARSRRVKERRGTGAPEGWEVTVIRASVERGASHRLRV